MTDGCWHLDSSLGGTLSTYTTRKAAEDDKVSGPWVDLWEREGRWMHGEQVPGWRPYDVVKVEREVAVTFIWYWLQDRGAHSVPPSEEAPDVRLAAVAHLAASLDLASGPVENVSDGRCHACGNPVTAHHGMTAEGSDAAGALTATLHRGCLVEVEYVQATGKPRDALQEDRHLA